RCWRSPCPTAPSSRVSGRRLEPATSGRIAGPMPPTIMGYVVRFTGVHQVGLALLSVAVFLLSAVPLELQRRIVNDVIGKGSFKTLFWLAATYALVALSEQTLKLVLNVYRGWVA